MKNNSKIKTWFVTGASSGVGKEVCKQLVERGYNVIAVARRVPEFKGDNVLALSVDVTRPEMIDKAVQQGIKKFGNIDVLMNNAGISTNATLEELNVSELINLMDVNFMGSFYTMKALLPHFRKNKNGTIINNTSQSGIATRLYGSAYCASKHALEGLTGAVWCDTKKFCRVMAVELGYFEGTEITKSFPSQATQINEYKNIPFPYKNDAGCGKNYINNLPNAVSCIIDTAEQNELPRRLMLGHDAIMHISAELEQIKKDIKNSKRYVAKCSCIDKDNKKIKVFGITLYKKRIKGKYIYYTFLGIPLKIFLKKNNL